MDDPRRIALTATGADAGHRLDVFIALHVADLSRARAQALIRDGHVTIDGHSGKASALITDGTIVVVDIPAPVASSTKPEAIPLEILHHDDDIVVINKAAGMVVHPAAGHGSGTLVNALLHHIGELSGVGGTRRPGIVHRLDKGTSGVMVVAKHDRVHTALAEQFAARTVEKVYQALVWGRPSPGLTFDAPIGRDPRDRKKMSARAHRARSANTLILDVEPLGEVSFLTIRIGTGRTHQIRVHLAEAGFPIVGDDLYGGRRRGPSAVATFAARFGRPFLHARRLTFVHPSTHQAATFEAPLAADLATALDEIRRLALPHPGTTVGPEHEGSRT